MPATVRPAGNACRRDITSNVDKAGEGNEMVGERDSARWRELS